MRTKIIFPIFIASCLLMVSCAKRTEFFENYQNPDSPLISLLPGADELGSDWNVKKVFSTQINDEPSLVTEDIEEVARRYFWTLNDEILDNEILLHFEVYKYYVFPNLPENIPYEISGSYNPIKSDVEDIIRFENCRLASSGDDIAGCTFVSAKNPLLIVISIRAQATTSDSINIMRGRILPFVNEMEQKMISWSEK